MHATATWMTPELVLVLVVAPAAPTSSSLRSSRHRRAVLRVAAILESRCVAYSHLEQAFCLADGLVLPTFVMMNNAATPNVVHGRTGFGYGIAATAPIPAGEPVLIDYGKRCKERWLLRYGFSPPGAVACERSGGLLD
eukprot:5538983-Prymnesium_polylepis.1